MSRLRGLGPYVFAVAGVVAGVTVLPQVPHHAPDTAVAAGPGSDCHAEVVAEDGTPPPGAQRLDPQKLCEALGQAEQTADCLGDWVPPERINARQFCIEVHRRGCGDPREDCTWFPDDKTYYYHH